jgi:hypothetical protein
MDYCSTQQMNITNGGITAITRWYKDEDGLGWKGHLCFFDKNEKLCDKHCISLRQTIPLGQISVSLDPCKGGAWKWNSFEGTGITERDLQWAMSWAMWLVLDRHRSHGIDGFGPCGARLDPGLEAKEVERRGNTTSD